MEYSEWLEHVKTFLLACNAEMDARDRAGRLGPRLMDVVDQELENERQRGEQS